MEAVMKEIIYTEEINLADNYIHCVVKVMGEESMVFQYMYVNSVIKIRKDYDQVMDIKIICRCTMKIDAVHIASMLGAF